MSRSIPLTEQQSFIMDNLDWLIPFGFGRKTTYVFIVSQILRKKPSANSGDILNTVRQLVDLGLLVYNEVTEFVDGKERCDVWISRPIDKVSA